MGLTTYSNGMGLAFTAMVGQWGAKLIYNGQEIDCIKTPIRTAFRMGLTNYEKIADTQVDVRRADAKNIGLYEKVRSNPRPIVTIESQEYEVLNLGNDDSANPIIQLECRLLQ